MTLMQARCALWRGYSNSTARTGGDKDKDGNKVSANAIQALAAFSAALRASEHLNAHLAPLWGLVTKILSVPLHDAAYLFLFSHACTVISAAVRASVMGDVESEITDPTDVDAYAAEDEAWLSSLDKNHSPEHYLQQLDTFDEEEYTKQDYMDSTTRLLDRLEEKWNE
ncbi:hypothetical protein GQ44DRAFT_832724 [Phaeosphaeriaceae sp. PMI808]|nr:hypothetical protein GQ44DRAFT_832724 [Phaeosphaeriaceae sp. PMI808]